jgi:DNA polymerase III subunit chi
MTRVDFHSRVPDKVLYACRLVRKARTADMRVVVHCEDARQQQVFDEALWTFSEQDFLPHVNAGDALAAQTPVILTHDESDPLPHHQVLINLSQRTPEHFARFERLFEVLSTDEQDLAAGRERYKQYQQRGYPLTHFVAEKS